MQPASGMGDRMTDVPPAPKRVPPIALLRATLGLWPTTVIVVLMAAFIAHPVRAQDFAQSRISILSGPPVAGEVIRYRIDLVQTGVTAATAQVSLSAPGGILLSFSGDCADARFADDMIWFIGGWRAGDTRSCAVDVLTYEHSAGANAVLHADVSTGTSFRRVESSVPLESPAPAQSLSFTILFLLVGGTAVLIWAVRRSGKSRRRKRDDGSLLMGAICIAFLGIFLDMARDDWRAAFQYEETQCRVIGATFDIGVGPKNHRSTSTTFTPRLALAYTVDGMPVFSSGFATQSTIIVGNVTDLTNFQIGDLVPCRFDPDHPKTVLVQWSPGLAYLFACLPLGLIILAIRLRR